MKTIKNLLFVAFAATSIIACQKELVDGTQNDSTPKTLVTFTATTDDVDTKTMIYYESELEGGSFKTRFLESDYFMVNGYKSGKLDKVDEKEAGTEIIFTVPFDKGKEDGPYYAVTAAHVADEAYFNESTHTYTLSISGTQAYRLVKSSTNTSYGDGAHILAAYSDKLAMSFKHMSTFLAITIQQEEGNEFTDNIETVYVRQGDGGNIAGKWFLKFNEDNKPYLEPGSEDELTSVISYKAGNVAKDGVEQGKVLIIGVPSYNYEKGLLVTIKDVNGKFVSFKINDANYAEKGGVIIPFNPKFNPGSGVIKTAQDWNDFAAAVNSSKDADLYRWVGNGTVTLGADINDDEEELATITRKFPYVFDGGNHTITRNKATRQLFSEVSGEIKNLTLKGEVTLEGDGAPFVKNLCAGAKLTNCTNEMNVKFNITSGPLYIGGIAAIMIKQDSGEETSTELTGCVNKGSIIGTGDFTAANGTVAIGGIIGDIRSAGGDVAYDVTFKDCSNEGEINYAPIPPANNTTTGMKLCGIGGIVGYIRSGQVLEFENCDNTGDITLSAKYMTNEKGMKAYAISMGGIIGFGTANSGSGNQTTEGFDISLVDCDNSGVLHNCGDNYSTSSETVNKVYTGGLAGSLMGLSSESKAIVKNCTNTGKIFTYDLVTGDQNIISARPAYNAVAGGLVGFGGNLDIQDCTITAQIGNGKRPMVAWGGVIGYVVAPFRVCNLNLELNGYYQRLSTYKYSRSVIANVPVKGITADIAGSTVEGTINVSKYVLSGGELSKDDKSNLSTFLTTKIFNSETKVKENLVYGQGYTANDGVDYSSATINYSAN